MYRELLLGCGHRREKVITTQGRKDWTNLTTLDYNPDAKPDILFDLMTLGKGGKLPFPDDYFSELQALEVLEHTGTQGEPEEFFKEFGEYWRVLKDGGLLCASVPLENTPSAWGDPGHRRIINAMTIANLSHAVIAANLGKTTMADYRRWLGKTNFEQIWSDTREESWFFVIRAIK